MQTSAEVTFITVTAPVSGENRALCVTKLSVTPACTDPLLSAEQAYRVRHDCIIWAEPLDLATVMGMILAYKEINLRDWRIPSKVTIRPSWRQRQSLSSDCHITSGIRLVIRGYVVHLEDIKSDAISELLIR